MAAPGGTPIQLYYSTTASAVPSAANLLTAELGVNVTDKKVYTKDGSGNVITLVGTLGNQNANAVAITGGTITGATINNAVIGGVTAAAGTFTTLNCTVLTASGDSSFTSTGAVKLSTGTTGERPGTPAAGMMRFNSTTTSFEGYNGSNWGSIGGGATGGGSDQVFYLNGQIVTTTYSIPSGQNAMSTGPLTINSGVTVTVPNSSRWVVL